MKSAIDEIFLNSGSLTLDATNNYTFNKTESHGSKQFAIELGLKKNWILGSLSVDAGYENTVDEHSIVIYFTQKYFTIVTDSPTNPSGFFTSEFDRSELEQTIKKDNPAGYISSITYGRTLVAKMTSSFSQQEMIAEVNAKFATFNPELSFQYSEILANSTFSVSVSGGNTSQTITTIEDIVEFIKSGKQINKFSDAVPISYEIKYLDNTPFKIGDETTYTK